MSSFDNQDTDQAALLTDFVLDDLQLSQQPFTSEPAGAESFTDGIAEAQLDDIKQALISGDDLLLILGPEGSGKSTLLNQLGANSGQRIQCFSVRGSDRFSTTNLFAGMLEAFKKQPPNDLKLMLDELIPCLQGMADQNTLGAIVLDDADSIQEAELTKLLSGMLYLNSSDETLLRVTLAAPTEFEERIPELLPEGADLPYSSLAIEAFDKNRSAAYLDYRLQLAGLASDFPFSDEEIAAINEEAGGRPGHLHRVAAAQLNSRDINYAAELPPELAENKKVAGAGFLSRIGSTKLLVGAAALAMIFAGLFWLKPNTNDVPDDRYKVVENKKLDVNQQAQDVALQKEQAAKEQLAAAQLANQTEVTGNTEQTSAQRAEAAKAEAQLQAKLEQDAAAKAAQDKLAEEKAEQDRVAAQKIAADKIAAEKAAEAKAAEEKANQDKVQQEEAEKTRAEAAATAVTQAELSNLESPNWILVQNPALFTVQMSASKDRKSVESFLVKNDLEAPNSIFSFERSGATWYALVHGLYGSIEEARRDIETMPESARSNQPWIRAVSRIQKALKEQ